MSDRVWRADLLTLPSMTTLKSLAWLPTIHRGCRVFPEAAAAARGDMCPPSQAQHEKGSDVG